MSKHPFTPATWKALSSCVLRSGLEECTSQMTRQPCLESGGCCISEGRASCVLARSEEQAGTGCFRLAVVPFLNLPLVPVILAFF